MNRCEPCFGFGIIENDDPDGEGDKKCLLCDGKGYTLNKDSLFQAETKIYEAISWLEDSIELAKDKNEGHNPESIPKLKLALKKANEVDRLICGVLNTPKRSRVESFHTSQNFKNNKK